MHEIRALGVVGAVHSSRGHRWFSPRKQSLTAALTIAQTSPRPCAPDVSHHSTSFFSSSTLKFALKPHNRYFSHIRNPPTQPSPRSLFAQTLAVKLQVDTQPGVTTPTGPTCRKTYCRAAFSHDPPTAAQYQLQLSISSKRGEHDSSEGFFSNKQVPRLKCNNAERSERDPAATR